MLSSALGSHAEVGDLRPELTRSFPYVTFAVDKVHQYRVQTTQHLESCPPITGPYPAVGGSSFRHSRHDGIGCDFRLNCRSLVYM